LRPYFYLFIYLFIYFSFVLVIRSASFFLSRIESFAVPTPLNPLFVYRPCRRKKEKEKEGKAEPTNPIVCCKPHCCSLLASETPASSFLLLPSSVFTVSTAYRSPATRPSLATQPQTPVAQAPSRPLRLSNREEVASRRHVCPELCCRCYAGLSSALNKWLSPSGGQFFRRPLHPRPLTWPTGSEI
jgi:hypothetical protein